MGDYITQAAAWIVVGGTLGLIVAGVWTEIESAVKKRRERRNPPAPKIAGQYLRVEDRFFCVHSRPTYHSDAQPTQRCYGVEPEPVDEQATDKIKEKAA